MNTQGLIDAVVQQTMVFIGQLATAGGVRSPLTGVADQVFLALTQELQNQGVSKKVIADMFGMALRTYHRRIRELRASRTEAGHTLWEAVLSFMREREPVSTREIQRRFRNDDLEILSGVLNDLVGSGLAYRTGTGERAVYRVAAETDFSQLDEEERREANQYLVWLAVYRNQPVTAARVTELCGLTPQSCQDALLALAGDGRIRTVDRDGQRLYESEQLNVPLGTSHGWEAAVLDHFQAMVRAVGQKLAGGAQRSHEQDMVGGSTWSLDVWEGHPLEDEATGCLRRVRSEIEELRNRIDQHNLAHPCEQPLRRVVFYVGQYLQKDVAVTETPNDIDEEH